MKQLPVANLNALQVRLHVVSNYAPSCTHPCYSRAQRHCRLIWHPACLSCRCASLAAGITVGVRVSQRCSVVAGQVLLECWHRLAAHFAINGMDARIIADNVVSGLAWHPPPPQSQQQVLYCPSEGEGSGRVKTMGA